MTPYRIGLSGLLTAALLTGIPDWTKAQERELGDAIDISHWVGEITKEDVHCWVESGVTHIIVRAAISEEINDHRAKSRRQLEVLWRAMYEDGLDFSVDIYLFVHWPPNVNIYTPVPDQVREAIDLAEEFDRDPPLPIGRLWIDLEEDPPDGQTIEDTVTLIGDALEACGEFPCGIYTRRSWWVEETGNTGKYPSEDYPLWYALYSCPLNPTFSDFVPFGSWTEPFGKQYDEGKTVGDCPASEAFCDKVRDRDIMYLSPKSDLVVTDVGVTSFPALGVPTSVQATLSNQTELSLRRFIPREFTVRWVHQWPTGQMDSFFSTHSPVEPGATTTVHLNWTPTRGTHTFRFVADVDDDVEEADEGNNEGELTVTVREIDLEVSGIRFTSTPVAGVETTAIANLRNLGRDASGPFNVTWILDGQQVSFGRHESLAGGEVSTGNVELRWIPTAGAHTLQFVADPDNQVHEIDETNNEAEASLTVYDIDLELSGIRFASTPTLGVPTTVSAHLQNVGGDHSGPFHVKWFLDGVEVGYRRHRSLAPGEVSTGNVEFDWTPTAGVHTFRFEADVDDEVLEVNEANNQAEVTVMVRRRWPWWRRPLIEYRFDSVSDFNRGAVRNWGLVPFLFRGRILGEAQQVDAVLGQAIELDGETTVVEAQNSRWLSFRRGVRVRALVMRQSNEGEDAVASKWYGDQDQWLLTFYPPGNGVLIFTVRLRDGTYASVEYAIPTSSYLGRWAEVEGRFDPHDGLRLYWNGQQVAYNPATGQRLAFGRSPIHIGDAGPGTTWSRFHGRIDDVQISR